MTDRCTCPECREGDALPDRLQGWPGAYQLRLFEGWKRRRKVGKTTRGTRE